ncbi:WD g-beta repeat containing protein [Seiridium cupressi]
MYDVFSALGFPVGTRCTADVLVENGKIHRSRGAEEALLLARRGQAAGAGVCWALSPHSNPSHVELSSMLNIEQADYRETAVKFQKEWHKTEPHRQLDFARHVQSHALINVLNKGLLYNSLEREFTRSQEEQQQQQQQQQQLQQQLQQRRGADNPVQVPQENAAAAAVAEAMQVGVFGPLVAQASHPAPAVALEEKEHDPEEDADGEVETIEEIENTRKRQIDRPQQALVNGGSPAKRPRLSNGYENGVDAATDPMELDGQHQHGGDNHAYPSPLEGEQAPTPIPRTDGPEQGTQVEKVLELAPETVFIPLGTDDTSISSPLATAPRGNGENAPVLLHCQWNPLDPTILAAGGTDALARIWTISRATTADQHQDPASNHVNGTVPPFHSLIEDGIDPKSNVTAMAWSWDGQAIAIATDASTKGRISVWDVHGSLTQHYEVPEAPVIKLRWSPGNTSVLAVAPEGNDALITVYPITAFSSMSYVVKDHSADLDVAWVNETDFLLCGGQLLMSLRCDHETSTIGETKRFEAREGDSLTQVHFDWRATLAATCGEKGFVDIWDQTGRRREIKAHDGPVTALAWQPLQTMPPEDERLIASAGEDGAIFIWNARSTDGKPKCSMTMGDPIVALSFTPDGAFIAGATHEKILVWKVGDHSIPRASWERVPHPGWSSPRMHSDTEDEEEHCLCWDATGQRLAFGVNSRLAIINFR